MVEVFGNPETRSVNAYNHREYAQAVRREHTNWSFVHRGVPGASSVHLQALIPISNLEKSAAWGLTLSPDRRSLVYVQNDFMDFNIMLLDNFQ